MPTLTDSHRNAIALAARGLGDALRVHVVRPVVRDRLERVQAWSLDYAQTTAGDSLTHAVKASDELLSLYHLSGHLTFIELWLVCRGLRLGDTLRGDRHAR